MAITLDDLLRFAAAPPPGDPSLTASGDQIGAGVVNASRFLAPTGLEDSGPFGTALTATAGFGDVVLGSGTFLWGASVPGISRNGIGQRVRGSGQYSTVVQLSAAAPRLLDFNKIADHDVFQNFDLSDLTVDCNNVIGNHHTIIGTLQNGTWQTRISTRRVSVRRVQAINVPVSATGTYQRRGISLVVAHPGDNEATQDTLTDILCEDVRIAGGAYGIEVAGTSPGNSANVKWDRITYLRCWHDTLVTPTAAMGSNGANFFIGSGAFGGSFMIRDCYGANSADVAYEIDNATSGLTEGCESVDAWVVGFLTRNFRQPADAAAQVVRYRHCLARNLNVDPSATDSRVNHYATLGDAATAAFLLGHIIYDKCISSFESALANASVSGLSIGVGAQGPVQVRRLTIRDFTVAAPALAVAPGAGIFPCFVDLRSSFANTDLYIENLHYKLTGTRSGAGAASWKMLRLGGNSHLNINGVTIDAAGFTGITASDTFYWVLLDDSLGSTLSGSIKGVKMLTAPAGTGTHHSLFVTGTGTLTILGRLLVDEFDTANFGTAGGLDYNIDATQAALGKVWIRGWATARPTFHGPLSVATAITPGASPYAYQNTDNLAEQVVVAGGTVSAIAYSVDGSTYTTLAGTSGTFLLRPGDFLKVTYTVAPTMTKIPAI